MDEAVVAGLDVAVEDRGVGVEAEFVRHAVDIEPDVGADLALVGLVVDAVVEDFGPAAGERAKPGLLEPRQHPADPLAPGGAALVAGGTGALVLLGDAREVDDLDRSESLDVQL